MKPLSIALVSVFGLFAFLYAQSKDVNDIGFVGAVVLGLLGAIFIFRGRFKGAEPAGQVLLGIADSLIIAASFGLPLIGGAVAGTVVILALNGRYR